MTKRKNRSYTDEFRKEAVELVTEQGYSVPDAASAVGITTKLLLYLESQIPSSAIRAGFR